jgi:RNA polymerase sigma factor (sigma-70 family)
MPLKPAVKICGSQREELPRTEQYMAGRMEEALISSRLDEISARGGIEDSELLSGLLRQDGAAFMALYDRFNRPVFRFLAHMTGSLHEAEELVQAVFATVWEGMANDMFVRFDTNKGTLEGYLLGIARHSARKVIARRGRTISIDQIELWDAFSRPSEIQDGMDAVERNLEVQRLRSAIARLPVKFREAVILCCIESLSYEDAAKVMSCSPGTVGSRVNRGKALLRQALASRPQNPQTTAADGAR